MFSPLLSPAKRPAILSALAAIAVYAITLAGTYVYDDRYIIQLDPRVNDASQWGEYWTKDYFNGAADNLYRPLVSMTYALQAKLHGNDTAHAWLFHLVNILAHAGVSAIVATLALRMTRSTTAAIVAGVIFAVHPIHVEAVANIVGRAELMCGLGIFGALVLFLRPLTNARACAIWACFVLALLSKEQGMLVPLFLLMAISLRSSPPPVLRERDRAGASELAAQPSSPHAPPPQPSPGVPVEGEGKPLDYAQSDTPKASRRTSPSLTLFLLLLWTLAAYILFRERILKFWWDRAFLDATINPMVNAHGIDRLLLPVEFFGRYLALLIAPMRQTPDYGGSVIGSHLNFNDPYFYIGVAAVLASAVACAFATIRKNWNVLFCILAFGLLFGMVSNLASIIGVNFAERLMYIPSAFACILAGMLATKAPRKPAAMVIALATLLFSLQTVRYSWQWNDALRLYSSSVAQYPNSVRLTILLAEEQAARGDLQAAVKTIARARELEPGYYRAWLRSATLAVQAGRLEEALAFATTAHKLRQTSATSLLMSEIHEKLTQPTAAATTRAVPTTAP